jgi:hypothetical protein
VRVVEGELVSEGVAEGVAEGSRVGEGVRVADASASCPGVKSPPGSARAAKGSTAVNIAVAFSTGAGVEAGWAKGPEAIEIMAAPNPAPAANTTRKARIKAMCDHFFITNPPIGSGMSPGPAAAPPPENNLFHHRHLCQ